MKNNKYPEIRFAGFTDDWEQRKLGDVFTQTVEYVNPKEENLELWSVTVEKGLTPKTARYNREALVKKTDKFKTVHPGDIVYNPMNMTIGSVGFNKSDKTVAVSGYYVTMTMNEGYSNNYFNTWLPSSNAIQMYKLYATGTLIEKQRVQFPTLSAIKTAIPSFEEQTKIGSFFKQLDDTIALHQCELDTLKETKQGFLQKMFPKSGAKVPKVRFAGFTDDWEQRKLGDLANIVRGASPRPIQDPKWFDENSEVGWLRIADVTEQNGRIHNLEQKISEAGQEKTRVLVEPHLLLSIAATVGKPVVNYVKTGVHDGFLIFLNPLFYREFMFQWLEMFRPKWQKYGQPGSQVNLNSELVRNQEIAIPTMEEQKKISNFFKQLDDTIALHQRELDLLKETKKGFLQKMFY
ncbi:MAG: restriction endonuclease subunit S [Enterococcus sp.]